MSIRPHAARWFEVLVAHDDVAFALATLARTGAVELEIGATQSHAVLVDLKQAIAQYQDLARRYLRYWPQQQLQYCPLHASPALTLQRALQQLELWRLDADPLIRALEELEQARADALIWRDVWARLGGGALDFGLAARAGPMLQLSLFLWPRGSGAPVAAEVLALRFELGEEQAMLALAPPEVLRALARQGVPAKGRTISVPQWAHGDASESLAVAATRLRALDDEIADVRGLLAALNQSHGLPEWLAGIACLLWFVQHVEALAASANFNLISGWTDDLEGARLEPALRASGARALLRLVAPPAGAVAPLVLRNPWWAGPFETFSRLLGVPSADEVDPSQILAVFVPLMFGYMFGDVGQGLILLGIGIAFRRWPAARLLIAGGAWAALFGLLYGSVFSVERLVPALWLHPLEQPLRVLAIPLIGGIALLTLGQILAAVEAYWRGELQQWCLREGGILACYLGIPASLVSEHGYALLLAGAGWQLFFAVRLDPRPAALFAAFGWLLEKGLQLVINTLSFTRVGAFALAHAGLSAAIVALMQATDIFALQALVLVAGNVATIALEGLVVSIQTTRLVLFEFFIRFLQAQGRPFRPLGTPPTYLSGGPNDSAN